MKILNRIVVFIMGIGVLPIMFFRTIFRGVISISENSSLYTIISKISSENKLINSAMEIPLTIKDSIKYLSEGKFSFAGMDFDITKLPVEMLEKKNWLIATGVLLAIAILIAVVIAGCALFSKAYKTIICLGAGGTICTFAAVRCFSKFAEPFLTGKVDLGGFLAKTLIGDSGGIVGSIGSIMLQGTIQVNSFQLGSGVFTMLIVFIAIMLWEIAYYVTLPENERPKKIKN